MDQALKYTPTSPGGARERRLVAMRLQEIEGNKLSPDQVAMFEMFDREGWPHDKRRAYLLERARHAGISRAAE